LPMLFLPALLDVYPVQNTEISFLFSPKGIHICYGCLVGEIKNFRCHIGCLTGCRKGFSNTNEKTNFITRLETARRIFLV
jgi:hypothetical protein